jgi:hypothetical protein
MSEGLQIQNVLASTLFLQEVWGVGLAFEDSSAPVPVVPPPPPAAAPPPAPVPVPPPDPWEPEPNPNPQPGDYDVEDIVTVAPNLVRQDDISEIFDGLPLNSGKIYHIQVTFDATLGFVHERKKFIVSPSPTMCEGNDENCTICLEPMYSTQGAIVNGYAPPANTDDKRQCVQTFCTSREPDRIHFRVSHHLFHAVCLEHAARTWKTRPRTVTETPCFGCPSCRCEMRAPNRSWSNAIPQNGYWIRPQLNTFSKLSTLSEDSENLPLIFGL